MRQASNILRFFCIALAAVLTEWGLGPDAAAQRFVDIRIDTVRCIGNGMTVGIGFDHVRNVVVEPPSASISHPQCTFLPDGMVCDSTVGTCTYRSPITFSAFDLGSVVTSHEDIDFVRLNIEHSWSGDVLIALECPNGQFVSLKNPFNSPNSTLSNHCGDSKFDSLYGYNMDYPSNTHSVFFGLANNDESSDNPCDGSDSDNAPGVGWNYCWSERSSHQYAPQGGLIYRQVNAISPPNVYNPILDSTHIAADSHYYRPEQSFDSLIGCPLSGTWNIVVQDSWRNDNGYIFDWQLAFDTSLYVPASILSTSITGGNSTTLHIDDTTVGVMPPLSDTTIRYTLQVVFSSGDTIDTAFYVHWVEPFIVNVNDTLCQGDTARWNSLFFTTDTLYTIRGKTSLGCDSTVDLRYTFMPSYSLHDTIPYCANEAFMYEGVDYGGPTTIVMPHQTRYGCDSTVTAHLVTIDSAFHLQMQMSTDGEVWSSDTVLHGCQPMTVWLRDTTLFERWRQWSFGDGDTLRQEVTAFQQPMPFTHTYDSVGAYTLTLMAESIHGCIDSSVIRTDAVHVHAAPVADFTWLPHEVVLHDPQTHFINRSSPFDSLTFLWNIPTGDGGVDTTSTPAPHYRWPVMTNDIVVELSAFWMHEIGDGLTLTCADSTMDTIEITNDYLQFPNLVTPNGDGVNDRWEIVNLLESKMYQMNELWIYDRWGLLVYHARDISRKEDFWDTSHYPDGTYFFRFSSESRYGLVRHNGVIEVAR